MLKNLCWEDQDTDENILQFKEFRPDFLCCAVDITSELSLKFYQNTMFKDLHFIIYITFLHTYLTVLFVMYHFC